MSLLRSKQDLAEHYDEISEYVHKSGEPVFIANNEGDSDVVILSGEQYDLLMSKLAMQSLMEGIDPNEKHPCVDVLAELNKLN